MGAPRARARPIVETPCFRTSVVDIQAEDNEQELRVRPQGLQKVLVHGGHRSRGRRGRRLRASLVSPRTAPPRRVRRDGADAARVAYRCRGARRRRRRRLAQGPFAAAFGRPRLKCERATRLEEADAGEVRRRGRRRGVVDGPGPVELDDAPLKDHGLRDARRRGPQEVDAARGVTIHGFASSPRGGDGAMCRRGRALWAAGRNGAWGRVAYAHGAARFVAAWRGSVQNWSMSLLAKMSSPPGAQTKTPRDACRHVKRDVGRGQQESRRRG